MAIDYMDRMSHIFKYNFPLLAQYCYEKAEIKSQCCYLGRMLNCLPHFKFGLFLIGLNVVCMVILASSVSNEMNLLAHVKIPLFKVNSGTCLK